MKEDKSELIMSALDSLKMHYDFGIYNSATGYLEITRVTIIENQEMTRSDFKAIEKICEVFNLDYFVSSEKADTALKITFKDAM